MINLLYGATGTGKTNELMKMITECVASGKSTLIIVPEQFTFEYERVLCEYMGESLFNNSAIEILSFSRLAKRILHESKTDYEKQQADASMKIAIMYAALKSLIARGQLVYYINQAKKVEFANKALTIITELVTSGVKPENLSAVIEYAPDGIKDKLIDITAIYTEYNIILESKNLRDSSFEITLAKDDANDSDYFSGMNVFFDEFKSFKNDQLALIETIMKQCEDATFSLTTDDLYIEFSNPYKSVSTTAKQIERIAKNQGKKCNKIKLDTYHRYTSNELVFLAENLMRSSDEIYSDKADSINLITATDPYMQCDYVCSQIRNIVCESDKGIKFSDIAVVSRNMDDSISTLKNAFRKYNIPFHTDESPTAKHKSLMVYILSAIELASSSKISTESLLRHLKTGIPNVTIEEINELENFCFKWDIDGVLWDNPFPSEDFRETPDIYEELTYANELRGKAITPIKELSIKLKKAENGKMLCDVIRGLINDVNVKDKLKKQELDATIMLSKNNILSYIDDENTRLKKNLLETLDSLEKIYEDVNISVANFRDVLGLCAENIALATQPLYLD